MYAVLEEIENNYATLIPDSTDDPIHILVSELPAPYKIGDVFSVEKHDQQWVVTAKDAEEKEKRLQANKSKRERLLNRTKKRHNE